MYLVYAIDNLHSGGAQRQAVELAVHLSRQPDVRIGLLIYRSHDFHAERLRAAGVPIEVVPKRGKWDPRLPLRLRRWLRRQRPDVVHAFLPWPSLWCWLAVRSLPAAERPGFIAAERSSLIATSLRESLMQKLVYRGSDAVTTNAGSVREAIHRVLGVPLERIHYLPNGIDLEAWDREAAGPCPLPLDGDGLRLALIGGLRREKNHELLLEALERLGGERTRGWRVWFVGAETGGRAYSRRVRSAIARRGLADVVRIEPHTPRIAALIARLDGVLLPSDFEGFPNVALEAMASRVPVIATRVGDVPNMIADGETGLLLPRLDAESLAQALDRLHGLGPDGRAALGARARAVVEERYAMPAVARRHLALYREVAAQRAAVDADARRGA